MCYADLMDGKITEKGNVQKIKFSVSLSWPGKYARGVNMTSFPIYKGRSFRSINVNILDNG